MEHRALLSLLVVAWLAGCGSSAKKPATEPGSTDGTDPTAGASEAGGPTVSSPGESTTGAAAAPADTSCKKLKRGACKVTRGCAWRDGPNAGCIDHDEEGGEP